MIWHLTKRELGAQFHSLTFWLLLAATQFIIAWLLFSQLDAYVRISAQLIATQSNLGINDLVITPTLNSLVLILLFVIPLLGMNSLASERSSGRLNLLLSTRLGSTQLLLGKWLGTFIPAMSLTIIILLTLSSLALGMQVDFPRLASSLLTLSFFIGFSSAIVVMFSGFTRHGSSALAATYSVLLTVWLLDTLTPSDQATHWLALTPHLETGFNGHIHSTHLLYFLLIGGACLLIAGMHLRPAQILKDRLNWRFLLFIMLLMLCIFWAGQLSKKITLDYRTTLQNGISLAMQQSLKALQGPVMVTAYAPDYPLLHARINKLIAPLQAAYPQLELNYVDPQKEPHLVAGQNIGQEGELVITAMQQRQHVRQLNNLALQQAFARLARRGDPWIVALRGHGEAPLHGANSRGLSTYANALEQQGYKTLSLDPLSNPIPDNTAALIIAANNKPYPAAIQQQIKTYLQQGGKVLWLHEGTQNRSLESVLGVKTLAGHVVDAAAHNAGLNSPTQIPINDFPQNIFPHAGTHYAVLNTAVALQATEKKWRIMGSLHSSQNSWNETGKLQGKIKRDAMQGEQGGPLKLAFALQNKKNRAIVIGDSDFARNAQYGQHGNRALALGLMNWLTENSALPTAPQADDIQVKWSATGMAIATGISLIILPLLFLATGLMIRRRRLAA